MSKKSENSRKDNSIKYLILIISLLAAAAVLIFVFRRQENLQGQEENQMSAVFISKKLDENNDFWSSIVAGVEMAADDYSIDMTVMGTASETMYREQNQMIERAIAMEPDAIILSPCDFVESIPYAKKIEDAGIKLILLDSIMDADLGVGVVSTDNYEGGYKMGAFLQERADQDSVIGIVSHIKNSSTAIEREQGVRAGLAGFEDQIAAVVFCDADSTKAYQVTAKMLEQYPEMNMVVGLNEDAARGAANAVKDSGRGESICMIGFDSSIEQIRLMEEGIFNAIVVQNPFNMGYLGVENAYEAVKNGSLSEASVDSGSVLITKETIYTKENEKLLFPFREEN